MNKQICVYFKMCIYLVSGERTLGIKFLIIKSAFIIQFFRFAISVSEDCIKGRKGRQSSLPGKLFEMTKLNFL